MKTRPATHFPRWRFVFIGLFSLALSGCMGWGDDSSESELNASFKEVIGFEPTLGVSNKNSSYYWMRDSYTKWLSFTCDEPTIARIRALGKTLRISLPNRSDPGAPGSGEKGNPNAPKWWTRATLDTPLEYIEIETSRPSSDFTDLTYIWIDSKTRTVYAERTVLD